MEFWFPDPDEPALMEWWAPLLEVARRVREERVPWPIHLDEFMLMGRVDRDPRPSIWQYKHRESRGPVMTDDDGRTYRFVPYKSGPSAGRFLEVPIRQAVWMADLPRWVAPVWYDEPPRRQWHDDPVDLEEAEPDARRRGRLRLVR